MEHITSRHNPLMGHIRRLAGSAAYRWETGEFLCDSPKLLQEALLWQAEITAVVTISCPGFRSISGRCRCRRTSWPPSPR